MFKQLHHVNINHKSSHISNHPFPCTLNRLTLEQALTPWEITLRSAALAVMDLEGKQLHSWAPLQTAVNSFSHPSTHKNENISVITTDWNCGSTAQRERMYPLEDNQKYTRGPLESSSLAAQPSCYWFFKFFILLEPEAQWTPFSKAVPLFWKVTISTEHLLSCPTCTTAFREFLFSFKCPAKNAKNRQRAAASFRERGV